MLQRLEHELLSEPTQVVYPAADSRCRSTSDVTDGTWGHRSMQQLNTAFACRVQGCQRKSSSGTAQLWQRPLRQPVTSSGIVAALLM